MSLAGRAFLALWNDFPVEYDAEYNRWHSIEHVPERVAVAGFLSGRRYVALDAAQQPHNNVERYFTWYELDSLNVLDGAEYGHLLDHPTPRSASMRPRFRNLQRAACKLAWSSSAGVGACAAVIRVSDGDSSSIDDAMLRSVRGLSGITGVHQGAAQASGQAMPWAAAPTDSKSPISSVLIVESYAFEPLRDALSMLDRPMTGSATPRTSVASGLYSLTYLCTHPQALS